MLKSEGRSHLLRHNGNFYEYVDGAWNVRGKPDDLEMLRNDMYRACLWGGYEFAKDEGHLWTTLTHRAIRPGVILDDQPMIAVKNGTIDLAEQELVEWSDEHYTTRRLSMNFNPKAKAKRWEQLLYRMLEHPNRSDEDVRAMMRFLQQWVGINVVGAPAKTSRALRTGLIIDGISGTGKSSFASVVRHMFGTGKVVSLKMSALSEQFGAASLIGASAWISDDGISQGTKADVGLLKALVTGEPITVRRKFLSDVDVRFDGGILFTTNTLPQLRDETDAIYNRFAVVKMDRVFTAEDAAKDLKGHGNVISYLEAADEFPGILNWALDGFAEAFERGSFTVPAEVKSASEMFRRGNDPYFAFCKDHLVPDQKHAVSLVALAWTVASFSEAEHNKKVSPRQAMTALHKAVREVVPGVRVETVGTDVMLVGIKVLPGGLLHWQIAKSAHSGPLQNVRDINVRIKA